MAPRKGKRVKSKVKRVHGAESEPAVVFYQLRFETHRDEETFKTLINGRSTWRERKINLDELHPSVHSNLESRQWLSLCTKIEPPPVELIREFYSNLSIYDDIRSGHYLTVWICGVRFTIILDVVSNALDVPIVDRPAYPYSESPPIAVVMDFLCGRSVTWDSDPSISSSDLTELNYIFFRIACHNIFPISHVHTIPIDRCISLYALTSNSSICFPSIFIKTIVEVRRSKKLRHRLFFPVFIDRVLKYLGLQNFPSQEMVHIFAPIGAKFLKQRSAQMKCVDPSVRSSKRPRVQSTARDVQDEEDMHGDPTAAVAEVGDDDVGVHTTATVHTGPPPPSLRAMMETIIMKQGAHGQHLDALLAEVAALRADLADYRRSIPHYPPSESC